MSRSARAAPIPAGWTAAPRPTLPAAALPTRRQLEVLQPVARGYANKEIAQRIGIRTGTVRNHLARLLDRTGACNRAELVLLGCSWGLIAPVAAARAWSEPD